MKIKDRRATRVRSGIDITYISDVLGAVNSAAALKFHVRTEKAIVR